MAHSSSNDSPPNTDFTDKARATWAAKGARLTFVREIICNSIDEHAAPFDAETLLTLVQKRDPLISISSVYRALKFLEESGLVSHIDGRDGEKLFRQSDRDLSATSHIVCRDCGAIIPMQDPCLSLRQAPGVTAEGFYAEKISLRIEASCSELADSNECARRENQGS